MTLIPKTMLRARLRLEHLKRWSAVKMDKIQSVAEHIYNVCVLLDNLPLEDMDSTIRYCLNHENSEAIHGTDIPSHIKDVYNIKDKFETIHDLSNNDYKWFKFADVAESWLYCVEHCVESWEEKLSICNDIALRLTKYCDDIEVFKWLDSLMYRKISGTNNIIGQQIGGAVAYLETGGKFNGRNISLLCRCKYCGSFFLCRKSDFNAKRHKSCGCVGHCDTTKLTIHQWKVRLMQKVNINHITGCWDWIGSTFDSGYGRMMGMGEVQAHRLSHQIFKGNIKKDMLVCHICDNPSCVNPDHLFVASAQDNYHDMVNKGRRVILRGEQIGNSELTKNDILVIRSSDESTYILAEKFNVTHQTISKIKNNERWKHVGHYSYNEKQTGIRE